MLFKQVSPEKYGFLAALAIAIILRGAFLLMPFGAFELRFVPDDTYYTLAIARNLALGLGPVASGDVLTNGFQPLIAFLEVPAFWFGASPEGGVLWAAVLGGLFDTVSVGLLWLLLREPLGLWVANVASLLWACSALALFNALGGLETSLALACGLGVLIAWTQFRERPTFRAAILLGAMSALALLARIDLGILVLGVIAAAMVERTSVRHLAVAGAMALLVLCPWWLYQMHAFGTVVPQSGEAVADLRRMNAESGPSLGQLTGWAMGYLVGGGIFDWRAARQAMYFDDRLAILLGAIAAAVSACLLRKFWQDKKCRPLAVAIAFAVFVVVFYVVHVPALYFFHRYLYPAEVAMVVGIALLTRVAFSRTKVLGLALVTVAVASGAAQMLSWRLYPTENLAAGSHGVKGYQVAAKAVLSAVPSGATLCAFQTGALGYFAAFSDPSIRVLNLDGVVNRAANLAIKRRALSDYALDQGCTYFADWAINVVALSYFSRRAVGRYELQPVSSAPEQGPEQFILHSMRAARPSRAQLAPSTSSAP